MRTKLIWSGIVVVALVALALANCRRFPEPGEPIAPTSSSQH